MRREIGIPFRPWLEVAAWIMRLALVIAAAATFFAPDTVAEDLPPRFPERQGGTAEGPAIPAPWGPSPVLPALPKAGATEAPDCCCTSALVVRNTSGVEAELRLDSGGIKGKPVPLVPGEIHSFSTSGKCARLSVAFSTGKGLWGFAGRREICCKDLKPGPLKGFKGIEVVRVVRSGCPGTCVAQKAPPDGKAMTARPSEPPPRMVEEDGARKAPLEGAKPLPPGGSGDKPVPEADRSKPPPCKCRFEQAEWTPWQGIGARYLLPDAVGVEWKVPVESPRVPFKAWALDSDLLALTSIETDDKDKVLCRGRKFLPSINDRVVFSWTIDGDGTFLGGAKEDTGEAVLFVPPVPAPGGEIRTHLKTAVDDGTAKGDDDAVRAAIHLLVRRPDKAPENDFLVVQVERIEAFPEPAKPELPTSPGCDCAIASTEWLSGSGISGSIIGLPEILCRSEYQAFQAAGTDFDDLKVNVKSPGCGSDQKVLENIPDVVRFRNWTVTDGLLPGGTGGNEGERVIYHGPPTLPGESSPNLAVRLGRIDDAEGSQYDDPPTDDERRATVIDIDLTLFTPDRMEVPEGVEDGTGGWVWVDSDNDDEDAAWDGAFAEAEVTRGDDELVMMRLRVHPEIKAGGKRIRLSAPEGWQRIRIFGDDRKEHPISLPADFDVADLPRMLFVEGAERSEAKGDVRLRAECLDAGECRDEVRLTVLDIENVSWEGQGNGRDGSDTLDADPHPNHYPDGVRVFPDAAKPGGEAMDTVKVRVRLNVEPPVAIPVYLKVFDVDDPSARQWPLDLEDDEEDNIGRVAGGGKAGRFDDADGAEVKRLWIGPREKSVATPFQVSLRPGDNYIVAAAVDEDLLARLGNVDKDGDADHVKHPAAGIYGKVSKVLTVWRRLHVELDSMGKVEGNEVMGSITSLFQATRRDTERMSFVWVDQNLDDGSRHLSDHKTGAMWNGRFENGKLTVANANANANATDGLNGNGEDFVYRQDGIGALDSPLPFHVRDNDHYGNSTLSGTVSTITREKPGGLPIKSGRLLVHLKITGHGNTPIDWTDFKGGTLSIGGGAPVTIVDVRPEGGIVVVERLSIPFKLVDDDRITRGTDVPMPDTSHLAPAFARAFVLPVFDVGDNNSEVRFIPNMKDVLSHDVEDFDAVATEASDLFWTVHLLGAYQAGTDWDGDPDREGAILGNVDAINGRGATLYLESMREFPVTAVSSEAITVAHQVGHLFGGLHNDCTASHRIIEGKPDEAHCGGTGDADAGLMARVRKRRTTDFSPVTLRKIRSINHP